MASHTHMLYYSFYSVSRQTSGQPVFLFATYILLTTERLQDVSKTEKYLFIINVYFIRILDASYFEVDKILV